MMNAWKQMAGLCAGVLVLAGAAVRVGAMEPFDNWANPAGFYAVDYPAYYGSQALNDKNGDPKALPNADLHVYQDVVRLTYYNVKPFSYILSTYFAVGRMDILNQHTIVQIGDPTLVGGWFFIDNRKTNTYAALGLKVDLPTGAYDPKRLANMGNNVYRYRPLIAFAKMSWPFDVEGTLTYGIRSENKDVTPTVKLGNEVIFESYAGMFVNPKFLAGVHLNYRIGSDAQYNGVTVADTGPKVLQVGASVSWLATPRFNALLEVLPDVSAKNDFQGILWLTRFAYKVF